MYSRAQVSVLSHNELCLSPCSLTFRHIRNLLRQNGFFFIFPDVAENSGFYCLVFVWCFFFKYTSWCGMNRCFIIPSLTFFPQWVAISFNLIKSQEYTEKSQ